MRAFDSTSRAAERPADRAGRPGSRHRLAGLIRPQKAGAAADLAEGLRQLRQAMATAPVRGAWFSGGDRARRLARVLLADGTVGTMQWEAGRMDSRDASSVIACAVARLRRGHAAPAAAVDCSAAGTAIAAAEEAGDAPRTRATDGTFVAACGQATLARADVLSDAADGRTADDAPERRAEGAQLVVTASDAGQLALWLDRPASADAGGLIPLWHGQMLGCAPLLPPRAVSVSPAAVTVTLRDGAAVSLPLLRPEVASGSGALSLAGAPSAVLPGALCDRARGSLRLPIASHVSDGVLSRCVLTVLGGRRVLVSFERWSLRRRLSRPGSSPAAPPALLDMRCVDLAGSSAVTDPLSGPARSTEGRGAGAFLEPAASAVRRQGLAAAPGSDAPVAALRGASLTPAAVTAAVRLSAWRAPTLTSELRWSPDAAAASADAASASASARRLVRAARAASAARAARDGDRDSAAGAPGAAWGGRVTVAEPGAPALPPGPYRLLVVAAAAAAGKGAGPATVTLEAADQAVSRGRATLLVRSVGAAVSPRDDVSGIPGAPLGAAVRLVATLRPETHPGSAGRAGVSCALVLPHAEAAPPSGSSAPSLCPTLPDAPGLVAAAAEALDRARPAESPSGAELVELELVTALLGDGRALRGALQRCAEAGAAAAEPGAGAPGAAASPAELRSLQRRNRSERALERAAASLLASGDPMAEALGGLAAAVLPDASAVVVLAPWPVLLRVTAAGVVVVPAPAVVAAFAADAALAAAACRGAGSAAIVLAAIPLPESRPDPASLLRGSAPLRRCLVASLRHAVGAGPPRPRAEPPAAPHAPPRDLALSPDGRARLCLSPDGLALLCQPARDTDNDDDDDVGLRGLLADLALLDPLGSSAAERLVGLVSRAPPRAAGPETAASAGRVLRSGGAAAETALLESLAGSAGDGGREGALVAAALVPWLAAWSSGAGKAAVRSSSAVAVSACRALASRGRCDTLAGLLAALCGPAVAACAGAGGARAGSAAIEASCVALAALAPPSSPPRASLPRLACLGAASLLRAAASAHVGAAASLAFPALSLAAGLEAAAGVKAPAFEATPAEDKPEAVPDDAPHDDALRELMTLAAATERGWATEAAAWAE